MKNTDNRGKRRKPRRRRPEFYFNRVLPVIFVVVSWVIAVVYTESNKQHEQKMKQEQAERAEQRIMYRQHLEDSLDEAARRLIDSLNAHPWTPEQRRRIDEWMRDKLNDPDPDELMERYNRGEELTKKEEEIIYDSYRDEYYEDPDDEGHYPSEIFDDKEDYDEEHVRDNPGIAGDD